MRSFEDRALRASVGPVAAKIVAHVDALIGRDVEFEMLRGAVDAAACGGGQIVLLVGEAGIGKTRLADELVSSMGHVARAAWGRCSDIEGAPPYWPWIQIIRALVRESDPSTVMTDVADAASSLARLAPDLRERFRGLELDRPVAGAFQLLDDVHAFLVRYAARRTLVLVLDDLHAADLPTLRLLHFVGRNLRGTRIAVVASYRDEAELPHDRASLLADIEREGRRLPLRRLRLDEVAALMKSIEGVVPDEHVVRAVMRVSEGTPLIVTEVVRSALASGSLSDPTLPSRLLVPDGIKAAIRGRVARVADTTRAALQVMATIGCAFDLDLVQACSDPADQPLEDRASEAVRAGIIGRVSGTPTQFRFGHALLRDIIYEDLRSAQREQLHLRVAREMERRAAVDGEQLGALAHHFQRGGDPTNALAYARRAGQYALARHAHEQAVGHFERALAAVSALDPVDEARRCELLLELADARHASGDLQAARQACADAAERARALGHADLMARAALAFGTRIVPGVVDHTLVALLEIALAARGDPPDMLGARLMARLAAAMQPASDPDEPTALARSAVALARNGTDRSTLAAVLRDARAAYMPLDSLEERLALDLETLTLAYELDDKATVIRAHLRLATDRLDDGELPAALGHIDQVEQLAEALRQPRLAAPASLLRASVAGLLGEFAEAEALVAHAEARFATPQDPTFAFQCTLTRFAIVLAATQHDELGGVEARVMQDSSTFAWESKLRHVVIGAIRARTGDLPGAKAALDALKTDGWPARAAGQSLVAETCAAVKDTGFAATLYDHLTPWARRFDSFLFQGSASRALGLLASALHRPEEARHHFETALVLEERIGARPWLAQSLAAYADFLGQSGRDADRRRAAQLRGEARTIADELRMPALVSRLSAEPVSPAASTSDRLHAPAAEAFRNEGDYWTISFEGRTLRIRDTKGVQILAELVGHPGRDYHVLQLSAGRGEEWLEGGAAGDSGADHRARTEYRRRLAELREDERDADASGDPYRAERARVEMEFLANELQRALGIGGRERRAAPHVERARVNVQRRIADAIRKITEGCPSLGRHLAQTIRTGTYCIYDP